MVEFGAVVVAELDDAQSADWMPRVLNSSNLYIHTHN